MRKNTQFLFFLIIINKMKSFTQLRFPNSTFLPMHGAPMRSGFGDPEAQLLLFSPSFRRSFSSPIISIEITFEGRFLFYTTPFVRDIFSIFIKFSFSEKAIRMIALIVVAFSEKLNFTTVSFFV